MLIRTSQGCGRQFQTILEANKAQSMLRPSALLGIQSHRRLPDSTGILQGPEGDYDASPPGDVEEDLLTDFQGLRIISSGIASSEQSALCCICEVDVSNSSNALICCADCNGLAHQRCYGVPTKPNGLWYCQKCQQLPTRTPNPSGAFKQMSSGRWTHLLCALAVPKASIGDLNTLEPIKRLKKLSTTINASLLHLRSEYWCIFQVQR